MTEIKRTYIFGGIALGLALLAFITSPDSITPDDFLDRGELFFPEFTDPNEATALEVIDFDEDAGSARPFKVEFSGGKWTIPSHYDYPADGEERLSKTAAGVIDIKKDDFRSDLTSDHEFFNVIDPLDETNVSLKGRGKRVTLKGSSGQVLADFIIGKEVENREGFRFVRIPDQKRVYAVRMNIDISTVFADWIERDLLLVDKDKISKLVLKDYSINERTGSLDNKDEIILDKNDSDWVIDKLAKDKEINKTKVNDFLTALDGIKIVGIRPKPEGITVNLEKVEGGFRVSQQAAASLQSHGFYFTRGGSLVSNEGELQGMTNEGITYTLRYGEIAYGIGEELSAGSSSAEVDTTKPGENRYLFITADFDPSIFNEPAQPANFDFQNKADSLWTDSDKSNKEIFDTHEEWQKKIDNGEKIQKDLTGRFGPWYYVISAESYGKLKLTRSDFLKDISN